MRGDGHRPAAQEHVFNAHYAGIIGLMTPPAFRFEFVSFPHVWHDAERTFPGATALNRDIHIIHILRGRGLMRVGDELAPIAPGRGFWIPPLTPYACGKDAGEPLEMKNLHFHLDLDAAPVSSLWRMPATFALPRGLAARLRALADQWRRGGSLLQGRIVAELHGLALDHLTRHARARDDVRVLDPRMVELKALLEANSHLGYNAEYFAGHVHLSVSQMNRRFREAFGSSPRVCHEQRRLAHAQALLQQDDAPIKVLAEQLGFCDPFYFCRWFTRLSGMAPTMFRRQSGRL